MKKFYSTMVALIAALAVSVSAAPISKRLNQANANFGEKISVESAQKREFQIKDTKESCIKLERKGMASTLSVGATTMDDLYGEYVWSAVNMYSGEEESFEVLFVNTELYEGLFEENEFVIEGFADTAVLASYDEATKTISINPQFIGHNDVYNEEILFSKVIEIPAEKEGEQPTYEPSFTEPVVLSYAVFEDGSAAYLSKDQYGASGYIITDETTGEGVSTIEDGMYFWYYIGLIEDNPWVEYGPCTWKEGILASWFSGTEYKEVETTLNYIPDAPYPAYRIMNPLLGTFGFEGGYLEFYLPSLELGLVPDQPTLIEATGRGLTFLIGCAYNVYVGFDPTGMTTEEYVAAFKASQYAERAIEATVEDGYMTVNFGPNSVCLMWPYAADGSGIDPEGIYSTSNAKTSTLKFKLKSDGVENIIGGIDENAPVEYYNLQGIRVNEPAKGQLVIKRQGNKAVKVVK